MKSSLLKKNKSYGRTCSDFRDKDSDSDGVSNRFDCQPYNPKKQGLIHDIKDKFRERKEVKQQEKYAGRQIRKKARAEYYREKEKQELRVSRERAKYEAEKKLKYHKSGGFFGQVKRVGSSIIGPTSPSSPRKTISTSRTRKVMPKKKKGKKTNRGSRSSSSSYNPFTGGY